MIGETKVDLSAFKEPGCVETFQRCHLKQIWLPPTEEELADIEKKKAKGIEEEPKVCCFTEPGTYVSLRIRLTPAVFPKVVEILPTIPEVAPLEE